MLPNVPAGGFETLEESIAKAKAAAEEAWALQPVSDTAECLIEIDKASGGDRATMERWFERAMKADGDNRGACWSKLDWLDRKWHGSMEDMLAFARDCRNTGNFRAGITLLLADAHWRIACEPDQDQLKYLRTPEVWADIKSVYDEYLKHHPVDDIARNKFALICHLSNHFREAEAQYVALGDRLTQWGEFPFVPLVELKQRRERNARDVLGKHGSITFPGWHFLRSSNNDGEWYVNAPAHLEYKKKPGILGAEESFTWGLLCRGNDLWSPRSGLSRIPTETMPLRKSWMLPAWNSTKSEENLATCEKPCSLFAPPKSTTLTCPVRKRCKCESKRSSSPTGSTNFP